MPDTCSTCLFFFGGKTCRFNAPIPLLTEGLTEAQPGWPVVLPTDWCADFSITTKTHPWVDSAPWIAYTPTAAADTGPFTTVSFTAGKFKQLGKTCFVQATLSLTVDGTVGAAYMKISLPFTIQSSGLGVSFTGSGKRQSDNKQLITYGISGGTEMRVYLADGSYPGQNAEVYQMGLTYETVI